MLDVGGSDAAKVAQRQAVANIYAVAQDAGGDARPRRVVLQLGRQGMAGANLAWDGLWPWLCAGFEVREKTQQHRVSTEGEGGGTMQRVEWCSFRSWLRREWPGRLPREVVAKSGSSLGAAGAGCVYAASRRRRCGRGVGWQRSDLVPSLWRSRRSPKRRGSSLWCFCCACCGPQVG